MRISTSSLYQNAVTNFNNMQAAIATSINEVDSGISLTSPSVDPAAAAQVLVAGQASAVNTQFGVNRQNATNALSTSDGVLSGVTNMMQSLESLVVEAGNGSLAPSDRATVAQQFQSGISQLMNLANSTDSNGNYMFSGSTSGVQPYTVTSNGGQYNGNQETQMLQVDSSQQLPVTVVGSSIFGNIQVSPNAYFGIPNAANVSTATISSGTVTNAALVTDDNYSVTFTSPTAYNVTDTSTGAAISTNNVYTSGAPITIGGVQFNVTNGAGPTGVPVAGDQFAVQPGNQNIFQALTNIMTALNKPTVTAADQTNLANSVAQANTSISASLNNVLDVRDQLGNSMQQITSLNSVGTTVDLAYQTTISNLQDANYAQVISQLSEEQFTYQAAQKAFAATSQLSLISMLPVA
ncbi:flagellar hook-associated protein FlgL [Solimicrobium silvestre]|uniref:Flagellar hook-associated protein 3 n=1 Tax=Solimicrobium silvestre TaxID=2099400 RepID=A0A2S9GVT3_9BURK|nr:flagellar hook-associated protein FlgL [Solimicrobium silvestre]PRC91820.1 Flagellar hook-associated protein 3 [Solimicrobium silvestre]